ncbi:MAG: hypothetical protein ABL916_12655 [Burkholderiaceae bacterium]
MNTILRPLASVLACVLLAALCTSPAFPQDAGALRAVHTQLRERLDTSPFKRPLVLDSTQGDASLKGDVYAVVEQPFAVVAPALQGTAHWCELLILHLNVKHCGAAGATPNEVITLVVGRKFDQPLADGHKVAFRYSVPAANPDYLRVSMAADSGPLGTRDYRLAVEITPLDAKRSFIHLSYSYSYGIAARVALQGYLSTLARDKVGFSVTGQGDSGQPVYVGGLRGVAERNTMRYYLAVEAYLGALAAPPAEQAEKRLRDWFAATERYPLQLHEMERDEYLAMKRREVQRQQVLAAAAPVKVN